MFKKFFEKPEKPLLILALALGFNALFAGNPYTSSTVKIDAKELALLVENKVDHITVDELADWIIKGKADYRLVDVNEEKEYSQYHIDGAENISLPLLMDGRLQANEKIILYSNGGIHAAQAWFLLRAHGFNNSYTLLNGLEEWKENILFPAIPDSIPSDQLVMYQKIKERSLFFHGTPQSARPDMKAGISPHALPTITPPQGGSTSAPAPGKKKKEGC